MAELCVDALQLGKKAYDKYTNHLLVNDAFLKGQFERLFLIFKKYPELKTGNVGVLLELSKILGNDLNENKDVLHKTMKMKGDWLETVKKYIYSYQMIQ